MKPYLIRRALELAFPEYWNNVSGTVFERADINSHSASKYMMIVIITCDNFRIPASPTQGSQVIKEVPVEKIVEVIKEEVLPRLDLPKNANI